MKDYEIKRTMISEEDIPPIKEHFASKYDGLYKAIGSLEKGEGMEIVGRKGLRSTVAKGLEKRWPRRFFKLSERSRPAGHHLYIIRKQ